MIIRLEELSVAPPKGAKWRHLQRIATQLARLNEASNPQAFTIQQTADCLQDSWELNPSFYRFGFMKILAQLQNVASENDFEINDIKY
jgi:hypothetical protein